MKKLLLLLPFILSSCATFETPRYSVIDRKNTVISSVGIKDVNIGPFSGYAFFNAGCKFAGPVTAPENMTFSTYLQRAFIQEFKNAGAYNEYSPVTITGSVDRLTFTPSETNGNGSWDISLTLYSSNGSKYSYSEHYSFPSTADNTAACKNTANAFVTMTQFLIAKIITTPDTLNLVSNMPKAKTKMISETANNIYQNTMFASSINKNTNFTELK